MAGHLVYFALGAAALTFLITRDMRSTISVVIVAGARGIAAGTPLAILGAIGRAARLGAIIKGGVHLETLGGVMLDKTGTLTLGKPDVQKVCRPQAYREKPSWPVPRQPNSAPSTRWARPSLPMHVIKNATSLNRATLATHSDVASAQISGDTTFARARFRWGGHCTKFPQTKPKTKRKF